MAKRTWSDFKEKMKEKRMNNGKTSSKDKHQRKVQGSELTIQRLSAAVTGKAQKYARVGPREFVPFDSTQDLTIENIKRSCEKYFAPCIGSNLDCDILAGEQGPSCKTVDQIPNLKIIHVRFINKFNVQDIDDDDNYDAGTSYDSGNESSYQPPRKTKSECRPPEARGPIHNNHHHRDPSSSPTKCFPVSLSVTEMIKLGKFNKATSSSTTVIRIFEYDIGTFSWSKVPTVAEFNEDKEHFAKGGFRKAYKATSKNSMFSGIWVIKRYLPNTIKAIEEIGQSLEEHTRKTVQMHMLARNFSLQLEQKVQELQNNTFGEVPKYSNIYYGETDKEEFERFIEGKFVKYSNNTGGLCVDEADIIGQKAQCLSHFSYEKSKHQVMLVDTQGSAYQLFDPEIASAELFDDNAHVLYCAGNLSTEAIEHFTSSHKCNDFCKAVGLQPLKA